MKENICAIIVTFFPDGHFRERLEAIRKQVARTIIVDNTGGSRSAEHLRQIDVSDIEIIWNDINEGIGKALNQGVTRAAQLKYDWLLMFDQDSWVNPDLVSALSDIYNRHPHPELVGMIGPNIEEENARKAPRVFDEDGRNFVEIEAIITSGSLLSTAVFELAGPFRTDFFIDFVDVEYCLRLRKLGYKVLMSTAPLMVHALGAATTILLDFLVVTIPFTRTNRPSLRRYYMTRNAILVGKQYFLLDPVWLTKALIRVLIFAPAKIPLESSARWQRFRATARGVFDGLRSKGGKITASRLER